VGFAATVEPSDPTAGAKSHEDETAQTVLYAVWKTNDISLSTKLRMFNSNVNSILLDGCETWRVTQGICKKL
jgi:hypothetical protein